MAFVVEGSSICMGVRLAFTLELGLSAKIKIRNVPMKAAAKICFLGNA
tara:strand:- start:174 stop:317 length:144 start_codon:yes stop_codon:yes gene_type:complete